jgi:hypothetical protein
MSVRRRRKEEVNSQASNPATFPASTAPMNSGAFSSPLACAASARSNRAYTSAGMAFLHAARNSTLRGDALFQKLLFARLTVATWRGVRVRGGFVKGMTEGEEVRRRRGVLASGTSRLECCRGSSWTSWREGEDGSGLWVRGSGQLWLGSYMW